MPPPELPGLAEGLGRVLGLTEVRGLRRAPGPGLAGRLRGRARLLATWPPSASRPVPAAIAHRWPRRSRRCGPRAWRWRGRGSRATHRRTPGARRHWWSWRPSARTTCARCCRRARANLLFDPGAPRGATLNRPVRVCVASYEVVGPTKNGGIGTGGHLAGRAARGRGPRRDAALHGLAGARRRRHAAAGRGTTSSGTCASASSATASRWRSTPRTSTRPRAYEVYRWLARARPGVRVGRGPCPGMPGTRVLRAARAPARARLSRHDLRGGRPFADALGVRGESLGAGHRAPPGRRLPRAPLRGAGRRGRQPERLSARVDGAARLEAAGAPLRAALPNQQRGERQTAGSEEHAAEALRSLPDGPGTRGGTRSRATARLRGQCCSHSVARRAGRRRCGARRAGRSCSLGGWRPGRASRCSATLSICSRRNPSPPDFRVCFMGSETPIQGVPAGDYIRERARRWPWPCPGRVGSRSAGGGGRTFVSPAGLRSCRRRSTTRPTPCSRRSVSASPSSRAAVAGIPELIHPLDLERATYSPTDDRVRRIDPADPQGFVAGLSAESARDGHPRRHGRRRRFEPAVRRRPSGH